MGYYSAIIGGSILFILMIAALVGMFWTPYDIQFMDGGALMMGASGTYLLGTDHFGRDLLTLMMKGAGVSLMIAFTSISLALICAVPLALLAVIRGGVWDVIIMRLNDISFAFPALVTAILLTAIWGAGAINLVLAIALFNIPVFARLVRSQAKGLIHLDFIMAAKALGRTDTAIALNHLLPNIAGVISVQASIQLGIALIIESGLSYLGLGTPPPIPSWGRMLAENQTYIFAAPHMVIIPGFAIFLCVIAFNLLGDGLRDIIDPRTKNMRDPILNIK